MTMTRTSAGRAQTAAPLTDDEKAAAGGARALIVVDVQNDFLPGGALAVPGGDEIIDTVNRLIAGFETVVLTADWHPAEHASFAASHPGRRPFETVRLDYGEQVLWPVHCVAGTPGAQFARMLAADAAALILRKGMHVSCDSYSGFLEADRRTRTGLAGWLSDRGVTEVFVCGLALDFCVSATAVDASREGFRTQVVLDASRPINADPESLRRLEELWQEEGVGTVFSTELVHAA